jgi:hypothetical protein
MQQARQQPHLAYHLLQPWQQLLKCLPVTQLLNGHKVLRKAVVQHSLLLLLLICRPTRTCCCCLSALLLLLLLLLLLPSAMYVADGGEQLLLMPAWMEGAAEATTRNITYQPGRPVVAVNFILQPQWHQHTMQMQACAFCWCCWCGT